MIPFSEQVLNINITLAHLKLPGGTKTDSGSIHPDTDARSDKQTLKKQVHPVAKFERQNRQKCLERIVKNLSQSDLPEKALVEQYLHHKYRNNCKSATMQSAYTTIRQFLFFLQQEGKTSFSDLTHRDVEAYIEALQNRGLKIATVRLRLITLNAFFRFLIDEHIMDEQVLEKKIRLKLPDILPRAIESDSLNSLMSVITKTRDRAMILLLLRTGMRIGELLETTLSDIDMKEQKIIIYEASKTGIGRIVYFSHDARIALEQWLQQRDKSQPFLFYNKRRGPLGYAASRSLFMKYVKKAGLEDRGYTLHRLRHSFASGLLNAGMRLEHLQPILGHTSIEVTRRYARLTDKSREDEYFRAIQVIEQEDTDGDY
ncbi:MAG: tyrosine-type recombinase/integrase [Candidatus Theseobacter exili]|nr:tyrosine-type recombinase/integrase [Candidatus Theseobacter exili]